MSKFKINELKHLATEYGIHHTRLMSKDELISLIVDGIDVGIEAMEAE